MSEDLPPIEAVIFDNDGTLVDSETLSLQVLVDYVAELGLHISHAEAMERFAGNELSVVFGEFEERLGKKLPDGFLAEFRRRQMSLLATHVEAVDGAADLVESLNKPFCLASNAPLDKIRLCLETTGLRQLFPDTIIFSAYQINVWKPEPDLFLNAASTLGFEPQKCAVVEDSIFGIKAGLAAGMQVFAYDPHGRIPASELLGVRGHVESLRDLIDVLGA